RPARHRASRRDAEARRGRSRTSATRGVFATSQEALDDSNDRSAGSADHVRRPAVSARTSRTDPISKGGEHMRRTVLGVAATVVVLAVTLGLSPSLAATQVDTARFFINPATLP